jgi:hypothetical protein
MARGKGHDVDFGFEPEVVRRNLVTLLVELGAVSHEQIDEIRTQASLRTPIDIAAERKRLLEGGIEPESVDDLVEGWLLENARREALTEDGIEWEVAERIAYVHAVLHGVPALVNGEPAPRCEEWPCRACGASFALAELCTLVAERADPASVIADDLALLAQQLRQTKAVRDRLLSALTLKDREYARLAKRLRVAPAPWGDCISPVRMLEHVEELIVGGERRVRQLMSSAELRNARPGMRGRPKRWALTALAQHLAGGGFSQPEIASILPDDNVVSDSEARADRVHNRLAEPGCRSIGPAEPSE